MRLWIIITMLLLALSACDQTPPEHCSGFALLTYARETGFHGKYGAALTEKVCIVAIKPLER